MINQIEKALDRLVEEIAVPAPLRVEGNERQVPQAFQAVASPVFVAVHAGVAQAGAGLDIEQEKQPVQVAEAFATKLVGGREFLLLRAKPLQGFVPEEFDGLARAVFQVFGDLGRVSVGAFVQPVQHVVAVAGANVIGTREGQHQPRRVRAGEDLLEMEAEQAALGPLRAIEQHKLAGVKQQHPPQRLVASEGGIGDDIFERRVFGPLQAVARRQLLARHGQCERVGQFVGGVKRLDQP